MRRILCAIGLHSWTLRRFYPYISYCRYCRVALDERAQGFVPEEEDNDG